MNISSLISDIVTTWWTPLFVAIFVGVVAYALWPKNQKKFDAAARMPLED